MQTLKFDEFLRSLKQNKDTTHSLFLGAGASVESGIHSATDCIWDWKHEIFLSQNTSLGKFFKNIRVEQVQTAVQNWLDAQKTYPTLNSDEEYSYYAEKAYPIEDDRRKYFQHLTENKSPSLGYHLAAMLAETGWIKSIWTTNFDGLILKTAHQYKLTPIEVTLESQGRIYRTDVENELLCVTLHGDYKYGALKNTISELDAQSETLINALKHELTKRNLIIIGYSGRDKSLMAALKEAYSQPGAGRLYWCGYGTRCSPTVKELLDVLKSNNRQGYYISTDGFDKTMLMIAKHCMSDNSKFLEDVDKVIARIGKAQNLQKTPFQSSTGHLKKIVKTNLYPVVFPSTCYQFKINYSDDEHPWNYCKSLAVQGIIAVPFKNMIYTWGEKKVITAICGPKLIGEIGLIPFSRDNIIRNGAFKELLVLTLTALLGTKKGYAYSKDSIWSLNRSFFYRIDNAPIHAFLGVKLDLKFDSKYTYLAVTPNYHFRSSDCYSRSTKKQFSDYFASRINNQKPNLAINNYVDEWIESIVGKAGFNSSYPIGSTNGFTFKVGANSALIGVNVNNERNDIALPKEINRKRIVFQGIECHDPELVFYNATRNQLVTDFHPMRGLIKNSPFDFMLNGKVLRASINLGVICPQPHASKFYAFLTQLNNKHSVKYNVDYVLPFPGFYDAFKMGLNIPLPNSSQWGSITPSSNADIKKAARYLGEEINQQLNQLSSQQVDALIIYIPKEYEKFTSYTDDSEQFDLHNFVKAYAVQKNIATQFVREKTVESDMQCQIMWALSLALYVKSCRVPWVISGLRQDTAFAGIGYGLNKSSTGTDVVVGCSHIYSADGQGLKYKLSQLNDVIFDRKKNPYLTEEEAYKLGLNIKELFYKSFTELPKRVVIHKRTPFRKEEISGLIKCLSSAGITDIDLLEINYEDKLRCFEYARNFDIDGFPIRRGLCFPQNENTIQMYTHGIAPSVRNPNFKYIQGGKTIPLPLKVVKHYGVGNMAQIATEILGLSKMNWNSFGLYSKLPCTIESSNEIARIGWLLSQYEGSIYDYRFFM